MTNIQQLSHYVIYWSIEELLTMVFYDKGKPHVHNDMEVVNTSLYTQLYTYTGTKCFYTLVLVKSITHICDACDK